jgi:hypothetical protein
MPAPPPSYPTAPRRDMMPMAALIGRVLGFTLLFVGTLVAVVLASYGGNCFNTTSGCNSNTIANAANGILTARILWAIGLFFLGASAGLKMHFSLRAPSGGSAEDAQWIIADRRFNGLLLILSIVLLFALLLSLMTLGFPFVTLPTAAAP